ncbi:MAG: hypothetical protein QOG56_1033 [Solirubrobacteraceae bacterium]|nr:hypothetical protein [Solirubrobacteraceae bacterium]
MLGAESRGATPLLGRFGAGSSGSRRGLTTDTSAHLVDGSEPRPLAAYAGLAAAYVGLFGGGLAGAVRGGHELPESVGAGEIALYGVATHRLSRLLSREKVARFARAPFTEVEEGADTPPAELAEHPRDGHGLYRAVGELLSCTMCLDQWIAGGFVVGHVWAPRATRLAASALAIKSVADALHLTYARVAD